MGRICDMRTIPLTTLLQLYADAISPEYRQAIEDVIKISVEIEISQPNQGNNS
jgi:hypothetical protein